jgi:DNA polymerase-3 subunit beta
MKIECIRDRLATAVQKAERVSGKNLTLPVLSCVLLEAINGTLKVKATNLDLGVEIELPVKVVEEGKVAVPGAVLSSFLNALTNDKNVSLTTNETTLTITTPSSSVIMNTINADDFPTIPFIGKQNRFTISAKEFIGGLRSVLFSASTSTVKPEYASVYINIEADTFTCVATDSFRLAEKKLRFKRKTEIAPLLIPHKNVSEIIKIIGEQTGEIAIDVDGSQLSTSFDGLYLTSRLVDGSFPDYKQIIPKEFQTEAVVLKQDFLNSMKIANIFSDAFFQVHLHVAPQTKKFEVRTKNATVGEQATHIPAAFSGEGVEMNFNYKYLLDCFSSIDSDSVTFLFNGPSKPLIIRGNTDKSFMYVVMPMNR